MEGFATPEEAAFDASVPERFQKALGVKVEGDHAVVYTLTNDRPPFEEYTGHCHREGGRWFASHGSSGWDSPPPEVVSAAQRLGHEH
jgi:hypothetical protein